MAHLSSDNMMFAKAGGITDDRPDWRWKIPGRECAICAGSQLLGHTSCILLGIGNVIGSASAYHAHGIWPAILIGSGIYGSVILLRFLCGKFESLPSLKTALFGFAFGIVVAVGIHAVQAVTHQQDMRNQLAALSDSQRQEVWQTARQWIEKQSLAQRFALSETTKLLGYESVEEFVALSYCVRPETRQSLEPETH